MLLKPLPSPPPQFNHRIFAYGAGPRDVHIDRSIVQRGRGTDLSRFRPSRSVFNNFLRIFFPQPPSPEIFTDIFPRMTRPNAKTHRVPGSAQLRRVRHRARGQLFLASSHPYNGALRAC
jgi:hypothetical protein